MSKKFAAWCTAMLLGVSVFNTAWADETKTETVKKETTTKVEETTKTEGSKSESITGFGNLLGSDHFLSVGVQGGYGGYILFVVPGFTIGGRVAVTLLNHLEIAGNYQYHSGSFLGVPVGTFNQIYGDVLFRTATGSGFFIGLSLGASTFSAAPTLPTSAPLFASGFTWGGKLGYDVKITNFLSLGVGVQYFNPLLDGILTLKFWF